MTYQCQPLAAGPGPPVAKVLSRNGGPVRDAALSLSRLALVAPYPFVAWGADELRRWRGRRLVIGSGT